LCVTSMAFVSGIWVLESSQWIKPNTKPHSCFRRGRRKGSGSDSYQLCTGPQSKSRMNNKKNKIKKARLTSCFRWPSQRPNVVRGRENSISPVFILAFINQLIIYFFEDQRHSSAPPQVIYVDILMHNLTFVNL
jgi:hypothetical protein